MTTRRGSAPSPVRRARHGGRSPVRLRPRPAARRARYPLGITVRTALSRRRRLIAAVLLSVAAAIAVLQLSPASERTVPTVVAARSLGAGTVLSAADLRVVDYPLALVPGGSSAAPADAAVTAAGAAQDGTAETGQPGASSDGSPAEGSDRAAADEDQQIDAWVGRTLAAAVVEGQPLTGPSVLGPDLLSGQPAGTTAVTIRVADPAALTHVRPGQHVDLIRSDSDPLAAQPSASEADERAEGTDDDDASRPSQAPERTGASASSLRVAAQLPVLWVADPAEPADGLLASAPEVQDDLLVVGADPTTAERLAAAPEGELVPVLVAAPAQAADLSPSAEAAER